MANNEKKDGNVFGGAVKTAEVKAAEAKTTVKKTAKKAAAKTETAKKAVETAAAKAETKVEAKVEEAKETVKEAAKATTKKVAAKKTAVRTTAKKAVAKKEVKTETFIQYNDEQTDMDAVLKRVEADLKAQKVAAKDIKLYIKPQDGACYYVADGKVAGIVFTRYFFSAVDSSSFRILASQTRCLAFKVTTCTPCVSLVAFAAIKDVSARTARLPSVRINTGQEASPLGICRICTRGDLPL